MKNQINTREDLNAAIVELRSHALKMCVAKNTEEVCSEFIQAKDFLISIYEHNVKRLEKQENT